MSNPEDHQMVSKPHQSVDKFLDKYDIRCRCQCDDFNEMVKLLDQETQRYNEKSRAFRLRYPKCYVAFKQKLKELMIDDVGKYDIKITPPGFYRCCNSAYLYKRIIEYQSLNNYLDYLNNNPKENELVDQFSIGMSIKPENNQMISNPRQSKEEFMVENGMKRTCDCCKCDPLDKA